jgi:hypothetical protein
MLQQRPETVAMSIPGTGHDLHPERPDILRAALEQFLRDITGSPGAEQS